MATATTEAAASSITEPKPLQERGGLPAPARRETSRTVHRSIISD